MNLDEIEALMAKAKVVAHHLTNCTDDSAEGPYLADSPENMEARKEAAGDEWSWEDDAIPLRIADDCEFATVAGFEGEPQWNTAQAIVDAGPVLLALHAAFPKLAAVVRAAERVTQYDWSDNDDDAVADMDALREKIEALNTEAGG